MRIQFRIGLGAAVVAAAAMLLMAPNVAFGQFPSSGSESDDERQKKLREIRKKLADIRANAKVGLLLNSARQSLKQARKSPSAAGYVFRADDTTDVAKSGRIEGCLHPKGHLLGTYAIAVVESDESSGFGSGGVGNTEFEYDVETLTSDLFRKEVPLMHERPGAWIAIDIADGDVGFSFNEEWANETADTGPIRDFLAEHELERPGYGESSDEIDSNVCGLIAAFESTLGAALEEPSPLVLRRRRKQLVRETEELVDELGAARSDVESDPIAPSDSETVATIFSNHIKQLKTEREHVRSQLRLEEYDIPVTNDDIAEIDAALSKLQKAVDEARTALNAYGEHHPRAENLRRRLDSLEREHWLLTIEWLPFSGAFIEKRSEAEGAIREYLETTTTTVDTVLLKQAEASASMAYQAADNAAESNSSSQRAVVFYLPAALLGLLIVFGAYRVRSRLSRNQTVRSDLEYELADRRETLRKATATLEDAADRLQRAEDHAERLDAIAFSDLGRESVGPIEAVDIGLSIASLEEHLLREAELKLEKGGRWNGEPMREALDNLQTESTEILPGSQWERTRIRPSLTGPLEVTHRRIPEHLTDLAQLASEAVESLDASAPKDGGDEETPDADVHW